ncbi:hypothetical protein [Pseudoalteromonas rubra]|nr:hypothetical protein [Pseudoalteromonas rubra]
MLSVLSKKGVILLEVRRLFGVGSRLSSTGESAFCEFKRLALQNEFDVSRLAFIAETDAALAAAVIEMAHRDVRFFKHQKNMALTHCLSRIGQRGVRVLAMSLELEQYKRRLPKAWQPAFEEAKGITWKVMQAASKIAHRQYSAKEVNEAMQSALILSLSCYAKIIACASLGWPPKRELVTSLMVPEPGLSELIQSAMGVYVEDTPNTVNAVQIAISAWAEIGTQSPLASPHIQKLEFTPGN